MKMEQKSISGLYYCYEKTSDENIRKYLSRIKIVVLQNKGTSQSYYPLSDESMIKILEKPRNFSFGFDLQTSDTPIGNLKEYKTIQYLVKSSSRFFLKPDIGEIIDQIDYNDLFDSKIKAIQYLPEYEPLPDTEGEHFLMKAKLLVDDHEL